MPGKPLADFGPAQIVTDGATQTFDCSSGGSFQWTLGASRTMSAPTNMAAGQIMFLDIVQDATGSRLVTWPSTFVWPGVNSSAPVLQTQAASRDRIRAVWDATNSVWRAGLDQVRVVPASKDTASAAAGPATLAAGDWTGAGFCVYRTTNAAPGTVTTRTATQMFADDPDAYIGKTWLVLVNNTGAGTLTLVGGTGVTITGTLTIATNITRLYHMTFASATTITGQLVSVGSVS